MFVRWFPGLSVMHLSGEIISLISQLYQKVSKLDYISPMLDIHTGSTYIVYWITNTIWQITAMAQPNQHDKMCHNWTRTAPMPTVQSCWFWYIVACLQETFLVPYYDESWNIDTAKSHCRFRGHGFKPMPQLKKKFTHVWHLPCCQCTVTCSHVSSIQNNNKANLRDLIAANGLVILLKIDSSRRFFNPCDLKSWWMTSKNYRAPLLDYIKLCASS